MAEDTFRDLYDRIGDRKGESEASGPYCGGNGRIDRAVDLILNEDFPRKGSILDVGGATGNLGYALRDHFDDRWVVDIHQGCELPAISKGNKFMRSNVDAEGLKFGDGRFDLVVALDFIEHIIDPQGFASECRRVLKPGGRVLINTPNIQHWRHLESLVVHGRFPHTSGDQEVYHGGHVAFFTEDDMHQIFVNFDDRQVHRRGLQADPPPPVWANLYRWHNKSPLAYGDLIFSARRPL